MFKKLAMICISILFKEEHTHKKNKNSLNGKRKEKNKKKKTKKNEHKEFMANNQSICMHIISTVNNEFSSNQF